MRAVTSVLLEALLIGVMLQVLVMGLTKYVYKGTGVLIISGALIHLLFEYSLHFLSAIYTATILKK